MNEKRARTPQVDLSCDIHGQKPNSPALLNAPSAAVNGEAAAVAQVSGFVHTACVPSSDLICSWPATMRRRNSP